MKKLDKKLILRKIKARKANQVLDSLIWKIKVLLTIIDLYKHYKDQDANSNKNKLKYFTKNMQALTEY